MVVSCVLILCGRLTYTLMYFEHVFEPTKTKGKESKCQLPVRQAVMPSAQISMPSPGKMQKIDIEETGFLLPMLQKEVMASGKALKRSVYVTYVGLCVCVGHLKCLRISLVVHHNSEQCDKKHIHNLKSPSEEHLSLIFIFQCVLLSRIMHVV